MDIAKGQESPPFSLYREPRMLKGMNEMDSQGSPRLDVFAKIEDGQGSASYGGTGLRVQGEQQEPGGLALMIHLFVAWRDENTNTLQASDSTSSIAQGKPHGDESSRNPGSSSLGSDSEQRIPSPKDFFQFVIQDLGPGLQSRCAPRSVQCICCRLTKRRLTT